MKNNNYNKKLKISVYDEDGNKIGSFDSFHQFRSYARTRRKLNAYQLRWIRSGELIYFKGYLIGLAKLYRNKTVDPLRCKYLCAKYDWQKRVNRQKLNVIYNSKQHQIIILDGYLKYLGCHDGTIKQLSKKTKVPVGTIKSSLSRAVEFADRRVPRTDTKYYIYFKDLSKIL